LVEVSFVSRIDAIIGGLADLNFDPAGDKEAI